ncbi:MAG: tRNA uridine-5-carboxymethylaminomethyl(34) synthesis enzyme MnmG, partial [Oxalobacteraceae bacterium]
LEQQVTASQLANSGAPVREDGGRRSLREWLRFGGVELSGLTEWLPNDADVESELAVEMAEDAAYAPYLARQDAELRDLRASETVKLGDGFGFALVPGLSREMVERLEAAKPSDLASAGRIPGITPAALAALLVYARRSLEVAA